MRRLVIRLPAEGKVILGLGCPFAGPSKSPSDTTSKPKAWVRGNPNLLSPYTSSWLRSKAHQNPGGTFDAQVFDPLVTGSKDTYTILNCLIPSFETVAHSD